MGRALQNIEGMLTMPYGCGEQNMARLAPNIYILEYLTSTQQLTKAIMEKASNFLTSGEFSVIVFFLKCVDVFLILTEKNTEFVSKNFFISKVHMLSCDTVSGHLQWTPCSACWHSHEWLVPQIALLRLWIIPAAGAFQAMVKLYIGWFQTLLFKSLPCCLKHKYGSFWHFCQSHKGQTQLSHIPYVYLTSSSLWTLQSALPWGQTGAVILTENSFHRHAFPFVLYCFPYIYCRS